jgi:DHA2 family lincomycin resistance protein-like MFS transporter
MEDEKRIQEASEMKRGEMLAALLISAFIAFLNENSLTYTFPELMQWITTRRMFMSAMTLFLQVPACVRYP